MVEDFARQAVHAGHGMNQGAVEQMMAYFCDQVQCNRQPTPILLDVSGVGKVVIQPWQEVRNLKLAVAEVMEVIIVCLLACRLD